MNIENIEIISKEPSSKIKVITGIRKENSKVIYEYSEFTREEIEVILEKGDVQKIEDLNKYLPDLPPHQNEISVYIVEIKYQSKKILALFKSFKGEGWGNALTIEMSYKETLFLKIDREKRNLKKGTPWEDVAYYPREFFASLVDKYLTFQMVPVVVLREINGEIGALQSFIFGITLGKAERENLIKENFIVWLLNNPKYFYQFVILEYLLGSTRRSEEDIIIQLDDEGRILSLYLIDFGNTCFENEKILERVSSVPNLLYLLALSKFIREKNINLDDENIEKIQQQLRMLGISLKAAGIEIQRKLKEIKNQREGEYKELFEDLITRLKRLRENKWRIEEELKNFNLLGFMDDGTRLITEEDLNGFWERLDLLIYHLEKYGEIPLKVYFSLDDEGRLVLKFDFYPKENT